MGILNKEYWAQKRQFSHLNMEKLLHVIPISGGHDFAYLVMSGNVTFVIFLTQEGISLHPSYEHMFRCLSSEHVERFSDESEFLHSHQCLHHLKVLLMFGHPDRTKGASDHQWYLLKKIELFEKEQESKTYYTPFEPEWVEENLMEDHRKTLSNMGRVLRDDIEIELERFDNECPKLNFVRENERPYGKYVKRKER